MDIEAAFSPLNVPNANPLQLGMTLVAVEMSADYARLVVVLALRVCGTARGYRAGLSTESAWCTTSMCILRARMISPSSWMG